MKSCLCGDGVKTIALVGEGLWELETAPNVVHGLLGRFFEEQNVYLNLNSKTWEQRCEK